MSNTTKEVFKVKDQESNSVIYFYLEDALRHIANYEEDSEVEECYIFSIEKLQLTQSEIDQLPEHEG